MLTHRTLKLGISKQGRPFCYECLADGKFAADAQGEMERTPWNFFATGRGRAES